MHRHVKLIRDTVLRRSMTSELTACAATGRLLCFINLRLPFFRTSLLKRYTATAVALRRYVSVTGECMRTTRSMLFLGSSLRRYPIFPLSILCLSIRVSRALLRSRVRKRAHHFEGNKMENQRMRKKSGGRRSGS